MAGPDEDDMADHLDVLRNKTREMLGQSYESRNTEPSGDGGYYLPPVPGSSYDKPVEHFDEGVMLEPAEHEERSSTSPSALRRRGSPASHAPTKPGATLPANTQIRQPNPALRNSAQGSSSAWISSLDLDKLEHDLRQLLHYTDTVGAHVQGVLKVRKTEKVGRAELAFFALWSAATLAVGFAVGLLGVVVGAVLVSWKLLPIILELAKHQP